RAGTGQDDRAHGGVGRGGGQRGSEVGEQALVEGVGGRPVEGEKTDAAFSVVGPDGAHAALRAGRTVRRTGSVLGGPPRGGQMAGRAARRPGDVPPPPGPVTRLCRVWPARCARGRKDAGSSSATRGAEPASQPAAARTAAGPADGNRRDG